MASFLITVREGHALTSLLNTNKHEVSFPEPKIKLEQTEEPPVDMAVTNSNSKTVDRKFEASLDWST